MQYIWAALSAVLIAAITWITWFPNALASAFMPSLSTAFYMDAIFSAIAALLSAMRGEKYIHGMEIKSENDETHINKLIYFFF